MSQKVTDVRPQDKSAILEQGDIYFFYRPKVQRQESKSMCGAVPFFGCGSNK